MSYSSISGTARPAYAISKLAYSFSVIKIRSQLTALRPEWLDSQHFSLPTLLQRYRSFSMSIVTYEHSQFV
jgi:hypothetical protein